QEQERSQRVRQMRLGHRAFAGGRGRELVTRLQTRGGRDAFAERVAIVLVLAVGHVEQRYGEACSERAAGSSWIHPPLLFSLPVRLGDDRDAVGKGVAVLLAVAV